MNQVSYLGKLLIFIGIAVAAIGVFLVIVSKIKGIGHLPGDIYIQKKNFMFYFPLTSCILISIVISFLIWIFFKK